MECRWPADLPAKGRLPGRIVEEVSAVFHLLSDPTRIRILHLLLSDGERPVSEVAGEVGMSVAAVSNQLRKMADLGFLAKNERGNFVYYRVVDECVGELLQRAYCLAESGKTRKERR